MTHMFFQGDCRMLMAVALAPDSVQCCVTSPPYFGLRDYGHEGQIGLEPTPDEYVARLVEVFRGVRRVLRDDGTLWLNIGDTYARNPAKGQHKPGDAGKQAYIYDGGNGRASSTASAGLPEKNLIGIPWRVAFALQADGWCLRQDIIWHKPNPMPESVRDRCTKAHEYLFLLSKSERYYFNSDAMKEPAESSTVARLSQNVESQAGSDRAESEHDVFTRNKRSVWTIATRAYKGAHFATFPPALVEPCVLAGSRPGDLVLDPFMGSGTTAAVAQQHGRRAVGCELNPEYIKLAEARMSA